MITLDTALATLDEIAPLRLAADWDNVGLLVDPTGPDAPVRRVFLCIDLTEPVFEEALKAEADLIVAYHPVIFRGWKRLDRRDPQRRTVIEAIRRGVAIYSPHTAADSAPGGVCDWLLDAVGPVTGRSPLAPARDDADAGAGLGRRGVLARPATLAELVARIKDHLGLKHVRVAASPRHAAGAPITAVAVCPGAGGSLFEGVRDVDLLLSGELRHHDVLSRVAGGTSVVLTDHTHCERGWLPLLAAALEGRLGGGVEVRVSASDDDPLVID